MKERELVVICGSWKKNEPYFEYWEEVFQNLGYDTVIPPDVQYHKTKDPYEKTQNRLFYQDMIRKAKYIIICNDIDYIGVSTSFEIGFSYCLGKEIYFTNVNSTITEVKSLLLEEKAKGVGVLLERMKNDRRN